MASAGHKSKIKLLCCPIFVHRYAPDGILAKFSVKSPHHRLLCCGIAGADGPLPLLVIVSSAKVVPIQHSSLSFLGIVITHDLEDGLMASKFLKKRENTECYAIIDSLAEAVVVEVPIPIEVQFITWFITVPTSGSFRGGTCGDQGSSCGRDICRKTCEGQNCHAVMEEVPCHVARAHTHTHSLGTVFLE